MLVVRTMLTNLDVHAPVVCALGPTFPDPLVVGAGKLAETLDAPLLLLHTRTDTAPFFSADARRRAGHVGTRRAHAALERARRLAPPTVRVSGRVTTGDPAEEVLRVVADADARAVAVGAARVHPALTAALGSVTQTIARHAPCPVVAIPTRPAAADAMLIDFCRERSTIVVASASDPSSMRAVAIARRMAAMSDDDLLLVCSPEAASDEPAVRAGGPRVELRVDRDPPLLALRAAARERRARMIVIAVSATAYDHRPAWTQLPALSSCHVMLIPPLCPVPAEAGPPLQPRAFARKGASD
jgi:nucleotide-binding universal stress UspA family protein